MMRFAKPAVLLLLLMLACGALSAQQAVRNRDHPAASRSSTATRRQDPVRLLSLDEGLSVLGAALESRVHLAPNSDCSHLVHAIYERAGFPYPYAKSSDLYAGVGEFRRVTRAQPGDLVVWPGHVGITISPVQHTFYSSLRSGLGVENYDAPYWRSRGRPRFYRYVESAPGTLNAANRAASLTPTAFGDSEPRGDQERSGMNPQTSLAPEANAVIPTVAVLDSARPSASEVAEALSHVFTETAEALRGKNVLPMSRHLIVFDQFEVERVRLERGRGWAEVSIRHPAPLQAGKAKQGKPAERQRWPLRYLDQNSWEVVLPPGDIYLPRDAAVRVLAHQLTDVADSPETSSGGPQKAELARLLNTILQK